MGRTLYCIKCCVYSTQIVVVVVRGKVILSQSIENCSLLDTRTGRPPVGVGVVVVGFLL